MAHRATLRRPLAERFAAWLYTGPLGHLWSAAADITLLWIRWIAAEAARRIRASLRTGR